MAGRGPAPKPPTSRRTRHQPTRGEWTPTKDVGWQFQPLPEPPEGVIDATKRAWSTWMGSWFAAHWTPDDLPGLRRVAQLYDLCERFVEDPFIEHIVITKKGDEYTVYTPRPHPASELRQMMDNYGITLKGQQDRRWIRPKTDDKAAGPENSRSRPVKARSPYAHLKVVGS